MAAPDTTPVSERNLTLANPAFSSYVFSRQVEEKDPFAQYYKEFLLLVPPYQFHVLHRMFEESDILQACVRAMARNIHGFGYSLSFIGDDHKQKNTPEAKAEEQKLLSFFNEPNPDESFTTIRENLGEDYEIFGNAALEVIRNRVNEIVMLKYAPVISFRMGPQQDTGVPCEYTVTRDGKPTVVTMEKRFRKYAQIPAWRRTPVWFKEFGDPRVMDWDTGSYGTADTIPYEKRASEIIWFSQAAQGFAYGLPRWIGSMLQVLGRRKAQFVNYDLLDNQGIPPFLVTVSNGVLSDTSWNQVMTMVNSWRGSTNFNRTAILESQTDSVGLDDRGAAKIEIQPLIQFRKDDMMFIQLLNETKDSIRKCFRISDLYIGGTGEYNRATAMAATNVCEEQIFGPERELFDEKINALLLKQAWNIKYFNFKSKGPKLVSGDEATQGAVAFTNIGAMPINHAIKLCNEALGLDISPIPYEWGNMPFVLVRQLMGQGVVLQGMTAGVETTESELQKLKRATVSGQSTDMGQTDPNQPPPTPGLDGILSALNQQKATGTPKTPMKQPSAEKELAEEAQKVKADLLEILSPDERAFYTKIEEIERLMQERLMEHSVTEHDYAL